MFDYCKWTQGAKLTPLYKLHGTYVSIVSRPNGLVAVPTHREAGGVGSLTVLLPTTLEIRLGEPESDTTPFLGFRFFPFARSEVDEVGHEEGGALNSTLHTTSPRHRRFCTMPWREDLESAVVLCLSNLVHSTSVTSRSIALGLLHVLAGIRQHRSRP